MYPLIARIYPKKIKERYVRLLRYADIRIQYERFIGFVTLFSFLLSFLISVSAAVIFKIPFFGLIFFIIFVVCFFISQIIIYFVLTIKGDAKARFVEEILPDVLQLMASNLRAGLTTDRALLLAARPEFGPFQNEINLIGKEITIGKDIGDALLEMCTRINSERLKKTMTLVVSGMRSGGELASLLDQTARNLRQEMLVDSRIRANVMMYVILIFIAVCLGAPLLFGMSSFLVEFLIQNMQGIEMPQEAVSQMPMTFTKISISGEFILIYSVVFLITSAIFGSLIVGSISKGKETEGLKFMPILLAVSLGLFFFIRWMIGGFFSSFLGI
jgi:archaeal flagellar protein FlaJ